jgi:undecaprenyl diphosphate synthase
VLTKELEALKKENCKVICIGNRSRFPEDIQRLMEKAERETENQRGPTLALALSYGGRAEIVEAARKLLAAGVKNVTETNFGNCLWTKDIPDPDLIVRTGGEKRLSGFLPWQSVYSELFFTDTLWPDFSKPEFNSIIADFSLRKRNFGA